MSIGSESKRCPQCGGMIPAEAPQGLCPKCLLQQASAPTEAGRGETSRPVAPARAEVAAAFPQLEILELVGQGGMGFVFKARQPKLDRFVALKILPQSLAADPAFAERFTREGRVLAKLNHPNIVTIHDFGQANGFFYLLMEFVDGVNLRQAMRVGRFTPTQALVIVPKICEALQFAHNEGILHRDIKPENILLDTKGRVKIADFGIAKLVGWDRPDRARSLSPSPGEGGAPPGEGPANVHLTETGKVLGTPHYMAPEQLEHPQDIDQRADIYSLGVVFYEMLTGELPIGRFAPPSEKSTVDPRVDEVVLRTLQKERERRQQSAGEVKTQVETIAGTSGHGELPERSAGTFARLALGLFLAGTLGTLLLMALPFREEPAALFGGVALILSVVFAVMSRRERLGKFVLVASVTVIAALGLIAIVTYWSVAGREDAARAVHARLERDRLETLRNQVNARETAIRPRTAVSFGPVVERVVSVGDVNHDGLVFVNLAKNEIMPSPTALRVNAAEPGIFERNSRIDEWIESAGVDLALHLQASNWGFVPLDTRMIYHQGNGESRDFFERLTPEEVQSVIADPKSRVDYVVSLGGRVSAYTVSASYIFKTRHGEIGALQISGFTNRPAGITIRYKLVQSAAPTPVTLPGLASSSPEGKLIIGSEQFYFTHPEPGELDWGFRCFVPPGHLASILFVVWTNGVPRLNPGLSAYYKVGPAGGIDVAYCLVSCYPIPESQVAAISTNANSRRIPAELGYPETAPAGFTNVVHWNVNLGLGFTSGTWMPMPVYHGLKLNVPQSVRSGHQLAIRLVDFTLPEGVSSNGWSGVELRFFLEPLKAPAIRMLPNEIDRTNYIGGTGLAGTVEEVLTAIKQWPTDP